MNNSLGKKIFNYNKTYNKKNNFENRLTQIETIVGINNNGTPNGNGLINMLECFNRDMNENKENLKDIHKDINNIKFKLGELEYRSVRFETEVLDQPNFQGNAAVNYTDAETPWTRIIEHKWFEFGKDEEGNDLPKTVISREYSSEWKLGDEPYYPVNDEKNGKLYEEYKKLAEKEENIIFGGRLGEYKYYDMDAVIAAALDMCEKEL